MDAQTRFFRISAELEMFSLLILLFIAVPLKHFWGRPLLVRWVGTFHGLFFLLFFLAILIMARKRSWPLKVVLIAFFSAFIPFGPLIFKRVLQPRLRPAQLAEEPSALEDSAPTA